MSIIVVVHSISFSNLIKVIKFCSSRTFFTFSFYHILWNQIISTNFVRIIARMITCLRCKRYFIGLLSIQCHITNKHLIFWVRKTNNIPHEKREEKKDFQRCLKMGQTLIEQKVEMGLLISLPTVCMYFDKVSSLHLLSREFWSKTNVFVKNSL